jgi:DNA-binding NtrC family response regulator
MTTKKSTKDAKQPEAKAAEPLVSIAIVDDDPVIVQTIAAYVKGIASDVKPFNDPGKCLAHLKISPVDMLISDIDMPEMNGIALLKEIKKVSPLTDVIMVTGQADKQAAIEALRYGAFDFFEKPVIRGELVETIKRTVRYRSALQDRDRLAEQVSFLSQREAKQWGLDAFVGQSKATRTILREIRTVQRSSSAAVLITGESGTGKELVARAIHFGGVRASRPFVPLNCSAVPAELVESTLFGHLKGSFTGATADKKGMFDLADGGTLFLDEIGDMPLIMQTKLLRVLEDGKITPVGGIRDHIVDVRIIAATNADLGRRMSLGKFRSDLYHRLAVFTMDMQPLRARRDDIPLLIEHFAQSISLGMGIRKPEFTEEALKTLQEYEYPGNVRELKNTVERALIIANGNRIELKHIKFLSPQEAVPDVPQAATGTAAAGGSVTSLVEAQKQHVRRILDTAGGNVAQAARLLGISRAKVYRVLGVEKT